MKIPFRYSDEDLRAMYAGGRGNATAKRFARFWSWIFGIGLSPRRWVTLEVSGRHSGRVTRFPLGLASYRGKTYAVSMLGENCNWVRNVRAAGGEVVIRHRRALVCRLIEIPSQERAAILQRYVEKVPGARPHIAVDRRAPISAFEQIASNHPVFLVSPIT